MHRQQNSLHIISLKLRAKLSNGQCKKGLQLGIGSHLEEAVLRVTSQELKIIKPNDS